MWNPALLKKHQETGQVEDKPRSGRLKKLTKSDEKYLKVTSLIERKKTSIGLLLRNLFKLWNTSAPIYDTKNSRTEQSS